MREDENIWEGGKLVGVEEEGLEERAAGDGGKGRKRVAREIEVRQLIQLGEETIEL